MTITIFGSPRSRTMRVLWMATELGLEFEHVPYTFDDPAIKTPEFLRLNPAGAVPTLQDGEFALSESLAINLYLVRKYGADGAMPLYPGTLEAQADVMRWSLFAQGHLEPWIQKDLVLAELIQAIGPHAESMVAQSLTILERALTGRRWLLGEQFTVADLNVAGVLSPSRSELLDLSGCQRVERWLAACYSRPAARETRARFSGEHAD